MRASASLFRRFNCSASRVFPTRTRLAVRERVSELNASKSSTPIHMRTPYARINFYITRLCCMFVHDLFRSVQQQQQQQHHRYKNHYRYSLLSSSLLIELAANRATNFWRMIRCKIRVKFFFKFVSSLFQHFRIAARIFRAAANRCSGFGVFLCKFRCDLIRGSCLSRPYRRCLRLIVIAPQNWILLS